ncbi:MULTISPECIES: Gfo/Idh/MocA family protein [Maribacter]|uniref:Gfo/Idh/MocA family oxidoreductase n=1 Tax=Maribacter flavus TaxID=1658664 RepID=A0ABU7IJ29_9FLAO|nr:MULTISPECIES: Gfo/Idh/MocA family oxidoreductase [Maribacter]MDC6405771.1 Gfo/Idh/MocA family oxidoreductase [Maribacter sp. PR66]MEE1972977.1 Gfo/Idh/MocA family oxidoreductase [Maribacter flavus]
MVRWGIVGAGKIAHSFSKDLALVSGGKLTAVGSRSLERAKKFADEYGAPHVFGSYDALFESDTVDVIYIATPHTYHAEVAISAMEAGKHVLCEKPMGVNKSEVERMIEAAKKNKVFLMEALWSRFNPTINAVKELVDSGEIGDVGYLYSDFAFYALDRDEKGRLLNPELAGGSLLDIGLYPIFLAYLMLGMPADILAKVHFHETGVEKQCSMIFDYHNAHAMLYSGLTSDSEMKSEISGNKGSVFINPRWHEATSYTLVKDGETKTLELPKIGKGYAHEIEEVHKCLQAGKLESDLWSHQNSLDLIYLMDTIRQKTDIKFPFEL